MDELAFAVMPAIRRPRNRLRIDVEPNLEAAFKRQRKEEFVLAVSLLKQIGLQKCLNPQTWRHIASDPFQMHFAFLSRCERV